MTEYIRRRPINLPPLPYNKFEPTGYMERVVHVLGLNYQELQDKFNRGDLEHKIAQGLSYIDPKTGKPLV